MSINGRLLRLEKEGGTERATAIYLILPAKATEADEDRAKALKMRELGLSPKQVTAWVIVRGI